MNRIDLTETLAMAKPALSRQEFVPVLTHFCFDGDTVFAYNDTMAIQVAFESDLNCAIPGDTLLSILGSLTHEEVELSADNEVVILRSGKAKIDLPSLPEDNFLWQEPEEEGLASFRAEGMFLVQLDRCLRTVGKDATRPAELGVTLVPDGNTAFLYSTDNATLSRAQVNLAKLDGEFTKPVVLPAPFCASLSQIVNILGDEDVEITIGEDYVLADIAGEALIFSKLILDADIYDFASIFNSVLPEGALKSTQDVNDEWLSALSLAQSLLKSSHDPEIKVTSKGPEVSVYAKSPLGTLEDDITFSKDMGDFEFHVDPILLKRASDITSKIFFAEEAVVCAEGSFVHLISHTATA